MENGKKTRVELVEVTPEVAKDMLSRNYEKNRRVRKAYVEQLATVMRDGRFMSQNGQTLVVGIDDNVLYDGQHRLMAVVSSGVTQTFLVAYVPNGEKAYKTIDNNNKRYAADFIDVPNKNNVAALAKFMACVEWGNAPLVTCLQGRWDGGTATIDRGLIVSYVEQNREAVVSATRDGANMRCALPVASPSMYAKFLMLVRYCGMDECLNEFVEEFDKTASENVTITALKMKLMKESAKGRKMDNKYVLGTLLDGYTHFCEVDDSTMFNKQTARLRQYQKYVDSTRMRSRG